LACKAAGGEAAQSYLRLGHGIDHEEKCREQSRERELIEPAPIVGEFPPSHSSKKSATNCANQRRREKHESSGFDAGVIAWTTGNEGTGNASDAD
jgi:hypothetical protein